MSMALQRLRRDLETVRRDNLSDFTVIQNSDNPYLLHCTINTHPDSSYCGKRFAVEMRIPSLYPIQCPDVRFVDYVSHPCVDAGGALLLHWDWSPAYTVGSMLLAICSYFNDHDLTKGRQVTRAETYKEELLAYVFSRMRLIS